MKEGWVNFFRQSSRLGIKCTIWFTLELVFANFRCTFPLFKTANFARFSINAYCQMKACSALLARSWEPTYCYCRWKMVKSSSTFINQKHCVISRSPRCLKITQNCLIYNYWILAFFVLLKLTCLVTLFDRKLQDIKTRQYWLFLAFLINFCPLKM